MEIFRNASNSINNRQFLYKGSDMNGNQYYEGEKDGHGWRANPMKPGCDRAELL